MYLRHFFASIVTVALLLCGSAAVAQQQPDQPQPPPQQQPDAPEPPPVQDDEPAQQPEDQQDQEPVDEQDDQLIDEQALEDPEQLQEPFGPGTTDLSMMGGVGNLLYLWLEPGIDFGLYELTDGITVSAGGGLNAGWCAICGLASLMPGVSISGWYLQPAARAAVHFNQIGAALNTDQLDTYAGLLAGVAYYSLSMDFQEEPDLDTGVISFITGPIFGARWTFEGTEGLFAAAELRLVAEFGQQVFEVRAGEDDDVVQEGAENVARQGFDLNVGIGYRF